MDLTRSGRAGTLRENARPAAKRAGGPVTRFQRDWIWLEGAPDVRAGDVIVEVTEPQRGPARVWLHEVITDPTPAGHDHVCWLRWQRQRQRYTLAEVNTAMAAAGVQVTIHGGEYFRPVRSSAAKAAILALWP